MAVELKVPLSGIIIFSSSSISTTIDHRASIIDYRLSSIDYRLAIATSTGAAWTAGWTGHGWFMDMYLGRECVKLHCLSPLRITSLITSNLSSHGFHRSRAREND